MFDPRLSQLKKNSKEVIKEIKNNDIKYINSRIKRAGVRVFYIKLIMYITGIMILGALPFSIIDFVDSKNMYIVLLVDNVILILAPIFFGFCLFKIFEWHSELQDIIEDNIVYNIDFIKIVNWQFKNLIAKVENYSELVKNKKNTVQETNYKKIISQEFNSLINYINEYSHFNSEKFDQDIIFIVQKHWYQILDFVNFMHKNELENQQKIALLKSKIIKLNKFSNSEDIVFKFTDKLEDQYELMYQLGNTINKMNNILNILKKFLNYKYKLGINTRIEKKQFRDMIKYYVFIINYDDIDYITDKIFFDIYNYKFNLQKVKESKSKNNKIKK